ncbi:DUF6198 family protein [Desulfovibrio sp.]|uniref:YczE/YyaS/YitT family protein n=1 Tax=Desulfovibrio sp. TaxID=885 RepID=UPI0023C6B598|nr:DUF6198 family protein [Desulfovibrio sp.]MDE7240697.1 hypothetical protein [Desulfovibrio sp.]
MPLRLLVFFVGLGCVAFGVAVTTKALLGTTPIAALPYSLSLIFPSVSFGACVIGFNLALIAAEWALLRSRIRFWAIFLQAFLACIFGTCVDGSMFALLGWDPHTYLTRVLWVAGGSMLIGVGAFLTIRANIAVLPYDAFVLALAAVTAKDFGRLRMLCDVVMSLSALLLCWIVLNDLAGVREGTILASLLTSPMIRLLMRFTK